MLGWNNTSLTELVDHILKRYHTSLKESLPELSGLLERAIRDGGNGELLDALDGLFRPFRIELEHHLLLEELAVFPLICKMEAGDKNTGLGTVEYLIYHLEQEHRRTVETLAKVCQLTTSYAPTKDNGANLKRLYDGLKALHQDLWEHINLENTILFPRAIAVGKQE